MRLEYTRSERRRKAVAQGIIDDPNATATAKAQALKTLDHLEANAQRRANPLKAGQDAQPDRPSTPWMTGYIPTPAQQAVIDRLLEDGQEHEAEVWFLTYQIEAQKNQPSAQPPSEVL